MKRYVLMMMLCLVDSLAWAESPILLMFRPVRENDVRRAHPAAEAALIEIEERLTEMGLTIGRPDASAYALLDGNPDAVVTFGSGKDITLLISLATSVYQDPLSEHAVMTAELNGRVFVGARLVAASTSRGSANALANAHARALDIAAKKAAQALIKRLSGALMQAPVATDSPQAIRAPATREALPAPAKVWALLVGVGDYRQVRETSRLRLPDLRGVSEDLREIEQTLIEMGVQAESIVKLVDAQATQGLLRAALRLLRESVRPDDQVVVALSAHGLPRDLGVTGFGYPVLYDTNPKDSSTLLDFKEIRDLLFGLPVHRIVWIVDTCHAGGAAQGVPQIEAHGGKATPINQKTNFVPARAMQMEDLPSKDIAILAAAADDQMALEVAGMGIFTRALTQGLRKTHGKLPLIEVFQTHVDTLVRNGSKEACETSRHCPRNYEQTPVFGYNQSGHMITF